MAGVRPLAAHVTWLWIYAHTFTLPHAHPAPTVERPLVVRPFMGPLVKFPLKKYPSARCLDGSPAGYHFLPGDPRVFVIHLHGGGECTNEWSCRARTLTAWGSSKLWWPFWSFRYPGGFIDTDEVRNKDFAEATMVSVPYCSGDFWSGQNTEASSSTFGFWMSGHMIVEALFKDLIAKRGLGQAQLVVLTGGSAGGIGAALHLDYLKDMLTAAGSRTMVAGAPFSGVHLPSPPYTGPGAVPFIRIDAETVPNYMTMWKSFTPTRCQTKHNGPKWQCMATTVISQSLESPMMMIMPQTDKVTLNMHMGVPGTPPFFGPVKEYVEFWVNTRMKELSSIVRPGVAMFSPACWTHTYFDGVRVQNLTFQDAFAEFVRAPHRMMLLQDNCGIDCGSGCPSHTEDELYNTPAFQ